MGAAASIFSLTNAVGFALLTGGIVVIARAVGRADPAAARAAAAAVFVAFAAAGAGMLAVFLPFASDWIALMGLDAEAHAEGTAYLRLMAVVALAAFAGPASRAVLLGHGRTRETLVVSLVGHGLHLATLPLFVHGGLGLPPFGAAGVATAFLVSGVVTGALGVVLLGPARPTVADCVAPLPLAPLGELWRIGAPAAGELLLYNVSQSLVMRVAAVLGTSFVAVRVLLTRLFALSVGVQSALGQASLIRTGQETGADGVGARPAVHSALRVAAAAALGTAALFLVLPAAWVGIVSSDTLAVSWTAVLLPLAVLQLMPQAMNIVIGGALRGAGETRWMLGTQAAGLAIVTAVCWLLAVPLRLGYLGVFLGIAVDEIIRAAWNYRRLRRRFPAA